eukprot:scaffold279817_cov32-Tisochrysis_lutea.AAC.3
MWGSVRSHAQTEIDAVANARKAQMATTPEAVRADSIADLNRKVADKRRTYSPTPSLAEGIIRAEELVTKQFFRRFTPRHANGDIPVLYAGVKWDDPKPTLDEDNVTTEDTAILASLRSYYVWLYSEKESRDAEPLLRALKQRQIPTNH